MYRVIGIQKDILVEYGVHLSYKQAWMGRKVAMLVIHASEVTSYDLLLQYLSNVPETNFGNVVLLRIIGSDLNELFFFPYVPACWVSRRAASLYSFSMEHTC